MKLIYIIFIFSNMCFGYNNLIHKLYDELYSKKDYSYTMKELDNIKKNISKVESKTIDNVITLINIYSIEDEREIYNTLKNVLKDNDPPISENNLAYIVSLADLMSYFTGYASYNEIMILGAKSKKLYEMSLKIDKNDFHSNLGYALWFFHAPKIGGGSLDKAYKYMKIAEQNAKENYQKYTIYVWLSQYYYKIKDKDNYAKYINMAKNIYANGGLLQNAEKINSNGNTL